MLLAPMTFDDKVLGVLVLSKLGLDQFSDDDLRLLVIYASFAAQAMANADTTERLREQSAALERQVRSQRELLQITESILTQFDGRVVLESITERLGALIACDNIAIEVADPATGLLTPLTARGVHAAEYLEPWEPGETGIATWVVEHNEPTYIEDERADPRVNEFRSIDAQEGSLIVVPLRGRDGAVGVLTIERLGKDNPFSPNEFELVQLFAAQVSIALQNAEVFRAVEIRAQTDDLTGLLNHGTFEEMLERSVHAGGTIQPDHAGPRRLPRGQQPAGPPGGRRAPPPDRPGDRPERPRHATCRSATAATSSRCCCPDTDAAGRDAGRRADAAGDPRCRRRRERVDRRRHVPGRWRRPPRRCCSPRTGRASSPSAMAATGSRRRRTAWPSPRTSRSRSPRRSTRRAARASSRRTRRRAAPGRRHAP